jgi:acyl carrier protein
VNTAAVLHDHIVEAYAPDVGSIPHDYDLLDGGVVDSLALVGLLAWIGRRFELPVEELDLDPQRLRTIASTARFIDGHLEQSAA